MFPEWFLLSLPRKKSEKRINAATEIRLGGGAPGTLDTAACSAQGQGHSVLVEADPGRAAA